MIVMSRRAAIYTSGCALAAPLATQALAGAASTGSVPPATSIAGSTRLNLNLQHYVSQNVPSFLAKARQGSVTAADFYDLSERLHLFARHVHAANTEPFRAALVSSIDTSSSLDLSQLKEASQVYAKIQQYDPAVSYDDFHKSLVFSPAEVAQGKQSLAANSIPWHLHTAADAMKWVGMRREQGMQITPAAATHFDDVWTTNGLVTNAIYSPEKVGSYLRVSGRLCGMTAKQVCQLGSAMVALGIGLAIIASGGAAGAAAIAELAAYIGWSVEDILVVSKMVAAIVSFIGALCGVFLT
jgi:hypothetical protein